MLSLREQLRLAGFPADYPLAGGRADEVAYVELGYPSDILKDNVVLVDTPGVNDLNEQRAEVTYGYVPRADAVLFLLDAGQALKDSERVFLGSHILDGTRERLIFVLGKMDLLNDDELAFYDALANNEASVRELGDETLAKIAHELTESLRQNVSVDWSSRDSVRAKLRLMVKRILRKYKYPPDQQEEAAQLVLDQAETLCEAWM